MTLKIGVFLGSKKGINLKNLKLINKFSDFFLPGKFELIFGGSETGLMKELAKKISRKNCKITSVFTKDLYDEAPLNNFFSELIITKDLEARNSVFVEKSDVFVDLPGGIGTLHEIITILNQNILKEINKKIFLVNDTFFWEPLNYLLQKLIDEKFLSKSSLDNFKICNLSELMKELENLNAKN